MYARLMYTMPSIKDVCQSPVLCSHHIAYCMSVLCEGPTFETLGTRFAPVKQRNNMYNIVMPSILHIVVSLSLLDGLGRLVGRRRPPSLLPARPIRAHKPRCSSTDTAHADPTYGCHVHVHAHQSLLQWQQVGAIAVLMSWWAVEHSVGREGGNPGGGDGGLWLQGSPAQ